MLITSAPHRAAPRCRRGKGWAGFARIKSNHNRFCTKMLRNSPPNAIGNVFINIHANFAADVIGLEAGKFAHCLPPLGDGVASTGKTRLLFKRFDFRL